MNLLQSLMPHPPPYKQPWSALPYCLRRFFSPAGADLVLQQVMLFHECCYPLFQTFVHQQCHTMVIAILGAVAASLSGMFSVYFPPSFALDLANMPHFACTSFLVGCLDPIQCPSFQNFACGLLVCECLLYLILASTVTVIAVPCIKL